MSGAQTVTGGTLTVDSGAVLTDASGITLSGGTLSGAGTISAATAVSGNGNVSLSVVGRTVTASGGTLNVTGSIDTTTSLSIANVSGSVLKLNNSGASVNAATVDTSNKTLEIDANTTLRGAHLVTNSTLTVDSGAVLTNASEI